MRMHRSSFGLGTHKSNAKSFGTNVHKEEFPDIARKVIETSDIILEIIDSRFIKESRNPEIEDFIRKTGKKLIYILNKADLVDIEQIKKDIQENNLRPYSILSCKMRRGGQLLRNRIKIEASRINFPQVRVGILGYPNVGKSSVINLLIGRKSAKTAFEAGFTKGMQKIKLAENIFIIDTPGIIPSKEKGESGFAKHVKISSRNYDKVHEPEFVVSSIMKEYPGVFEKFYKIRAKNNPDVLIEKLGRKKCFLCKGNEVDIDRTARIILKDWQEGKMQNLVKK